MTGRTFDQLSPAEQRTAGILFKYDDGMEPEAIAAHYQMELTDVAAILEDKAERLSAWTAAYREERQVRLPPDRRRPSNICRECAGRWIGEVMTARRAGNLECRAASCWHNLKTGERTDDLRIAFLTYGTREWIQISGVLPYQWTLLYKRLLADDGVELRGHELHRAALERGATVLSEGAGIFASYSPNRPENRT